MLSAGKVGKIGRCRLTQEGSSRGWGQISVVGVGAVVECQAGLLEVVLATHACGGFADLLHGRQQQADEDGDDGNHDKQLDQGEATPFSVRPNTCCKHGETSQEKHKQEGFVASLVARAAHRPNKLRPNFSLIVRARRKFLNFFGSGFARNGIQHRQADC